MAKNENLDLLIRCKNRDKLAFRYFVEEYHKMVYTLCYRMIYDEEDAKDITQETFIKAWEKIEQIDLNKKVRNWLYKIASNMCIDRIRKRKENVIPFDRSYQMIDKLYANNSPENQLVSKELGMAIKSLIGELSPKQKLVITLKDIEGMEISEIKSISGLDENKIKSNLYLARKKIRTQLSNYEYARR